MLPKLDSRAIVSPAYLEVGPLSVSAQERLLPRNTFVDAYVDYVWPVLLECLAGPRYLRNKAWTWVSPYSGRAVLVSPMVNVILDIDTDARSVIHAPSQALSEEPGFERLVIYQRRLHTYKAHILKYCPDTKAPYFEEFTFRRVV